MQRREQEQEQEQPPRFLSFFLRHLMNDRKGVERESSSKIGASVAEEEARSPSTSLVVFGRSSDNEVLKYDGTEVN